MARVFDMCEICKLDKAGICNYECIKTRSDRIYRFHTCPNYIYDDGNPITNAELLSTDLKTDSEMAAVQLWYNLAMDYSFESLDEFKEWLKKKAVID